MPGMVRTAMNPIGKLEPSVVAVNVLDAMRHDRPYVFTDDHSVEEVEERHAVDPFGGGRRNAPVTTAASPSDQLVLIEGDGPVRLLTLNRPTRLNAFTSASYRRLAVELLQGGGR